MNHYEQRQQTRKIRLQNRAEKARAEGEALYQRASELADLIPFGQPILIGHYSEQRDRAFRRKIVRTGERAFEAWGKARELEARAASVGKAGISSDDPDALPKLRERLAELEAKQDQMRAANRIYRSKGTEEEKLDRLMVLGLSEQVAREGMKGDMCGRIGFPDYALSNNSANIRRLKERIAGLEKAAIRPAATPMEGDGWTIREDPEENRILIEFQGVPAKETRDLLKRSGWRWSPSRKAWVRMLNANGRGAAKIAAEQLGRAAH
jgi:hypothetical protein